MADEPKNKVIMLRVSQAERDRIQEKMAEIGVENMSAYIRKMALDGICVNMDLTDVTQMVKLLRYASNNLNQYTKKAHETGSIYSEDIEDLQRRLDDLWESCKEILTRLATVQ
ncbi:MAG: plasmid mobilization relaxosome protein MobC [Clostridiales bacterium]|nr:plasmid mobilization relaxosome protein MobC [Clostridiales bacterium]